MTEQEEFEFRHRFEQEQAKPAQASADPTEGMGTVDKLRAGIGQGMTKVARAAASGVRLLGPQYDASADFFGLPNKADSAEAARLDAPLLNTTAGKIGSVVGQVAGAAPTMLVPGANTYLGATAVGGLVGGATTEGDLKDRAVGAGFGAAGGAAGKAAGDLIGKGLGKLVDTSKANALARQTANAGRDEAAQNALRAGYTLPPTEINPTTTSKALEGLSGKIKTSQAASAQNQTVTNNLAKAELGLPQDAPLSIDALKTIRSEAGKAYEAVSSVGTIKPGTAYEQALDNITANARKAAQGFPGDAPNPLIAKIEALRSKEFDASSAIAKIKSLRSDADAAYASGNKELGSALKSGAGALEDAIEAHLKATGAPQGLLDGFRAARQTIAKTYSVEKALNPTTGDVSASVLAAQLKRGRPLSGGLQTIGEAGQAFPKATQALSQNYNALSPLDYMGGMLAGAHTGGLGAAATLARPGVRSVILSKPYQNMLANPSYGPNAALSGAQNVLTNEYLRRLVPGSAAALVPAGQQ